MKRLLIICALLVPCLVSASGYSPSLIYVLEQLRHSKSDMILPRASKPRPFIGGCEVGMRGASGEFFLLISYFRNRAEKTDIQLMLKDTSPVVRVMGAYLVLTADDDLKDISLEQLSNDQTLIEVTPGGCVTYELSVARVVQNIKEHRDYFGERGYQLMRAEEALKNEANHTAEPSSPSRAGSP